MSEATEPEPLHLFEGFGIELEYMIVDGETLSIRPLADGLLAEVGGGYELEVELGPAAWSNELALHVIELKTNGPSRSLDGLAAMFQEQLAHVHQLLAPMGARLLPAAMHPWMDPDTELKLWPHDNNTIYQTFDRIFDCRGHGWSNLQSMHINLPFEGDDEFGRLHAAIRLVLPLLPGLAASSPFVAGERSAFLDARLNAYRYNAARIPSVTGHVVPERVFSRRDYEERLLRRIYDDLAALDPEGVLRHEWVNARGCIARFDRMAIEIRVLDVQESPRADLAIAAAVVEVVRAQANQVWIDTEEQQRWDERALAAILFDAIRDADGAIIEDRSFLRAFGYPERGATRLGELWQHLIETRLTGERFDEWRPALELITRQGCLARRLVAAAGDTPSRTRLTEVYGRLADCLTAGELFRAQ